MTHHQNFSDETFVNAILQEREWCEFVTSKDTLGEYYFDLDDEVVMNLVLQYSLKDTEGEKKAHYIIDDKASCMGTRAYFKIMDLMVQINKVERY